MGVCTYCKAMYPDEMLMRGGLCPYCLQRNTQPAPKEKEMANVTVEELAAAETARLATQSAARDIATRAYFAALGGVSTINDVGVEQTPKLAFEIALATVRQWPGFMAQVDEAVKEQINAEHHAAGPWHTDVENIPRGWVQF